MIWWLVIVLISYLADLISWQLEESSSLGAEYQFSFWRRPRKLATRSPPFDSKSSPLDLDGVLPFMVDVLPLIPKSPFFDPLSPPFDPRSFGFARKVWEERPVRRSEDFELRRTLEQNRATLHSSVQDTRPSTKCFLYLIESRRGGSSSSRSVHFDFVWGKSSGKREREKEGDREDASWKYTSTSAPVRSLSLDDEVGRFFSTLLLENIASRWGRRPSGYLGFFLSFFFLFLSSPATWFCSYAHWGSILIFAAPLGIGESSSILWRTIGANPPRGTRFRKGSALWSPENSWWWEF